MLNTDSWTQGYVADVSYDYSFFSELAPIEIGFNLLNRGFFPPSLGQFTYCELGCGQGFTTNVLAAANPQGEFWGIDFNPTHVAEAQRLADAAKLSNIRFLDQSFAEFLKTQTPKFDFITLHGVYSWINADNRQVIVDILRQKLKVGGAVYISYNALPGWSTVQPMRDLMAKYTEGIDNSSLQRVNKGMTFAHQLHQLQGKYFTENPSVIHDLQALEHSSYNYLAHEYFNHDFCPLYHVDVAQQLSAAKLTFATSADADAQFQDLALDKQQSEFLATLDKPALCETTRDFFLNTRFRRDIFLRGPIRLSALEQGEYLSKMRFALIIDPDTIDKEPELAGQPIPLKQEIVQPIVAALADRPQTLRALIQQPSLARLDFASVLQTLNLLVATCAVVPALPQDHEDERHQAIAGLNTEILKRSRFGADTQVLASPMTGSGIEISRPEQLFLLAHQCGADPAPFIWTILQLQGAKLMKEDNVLETPEENIAELNKQARHFKASRLPTFQRLGLAS